MNWFPRTVQTLVRPRACTCENHDPQGENTFERNLEHLCLRGGVSTFCGTTDLRGHTWVAFEQPYIFTRMIRWSSLLACCGTIAASAQQGTMACGGDAANANGSVSYSIGQVAYSPLATPQGTVNEGVQQPYEWLVMNAPDAAAELNATLLPNPTNAGVTIQLSDPLVEALSYTLRDAAGRMVRGAAVTSTQFMVPMEDLQSATYTIVLTTEQKAVATFRVIKH